MRLSAPAVQGRFEPKKRGWKSSGNSSGTGILIRTLALPRQDWPKNDSKNGWLIYFFNGWPCHCSGGYCSVSTFASLVPIDPRRKLRLASSSFYQSCGGLLWGHDGRKTNALLCTLMYNYWNITRCQAFFKIIPSKNIVCFEVPLFLQKSLQPL